MNAKKIFLIGFMGAGKTTLGKQLAKKMAFDFIDSDKEIEQITQKTIPQIFEERGEDGFRKLEREWLECLDRDEVVISLGGGTPCFNSNMDLINQLGESIYIQLTPAELAVRLKNSKTKRPLIDAIKDDKNKLETFIADLLAKREVFYKKASYTVQGRDITVSKLMDGLKPEQL